MKNPKTYLVLCLLTLAGFVARLPQLHEGFWRDEMSTLYVISAKNLSDLLPRLVVMEFSPPVFYVLMHYWAKLAGTGEVAMKIPALFFGLLLIPIVYLLGKELGGRTVGIWSAIFAICSSQTIFYSLQCRTYSLIAVVYCLIAFYYCRFIDNYDSRKYCRVVLFLLFLLALYLHYTSVILITSLFLATIILCIMKKLDMKIVDWLLLFLLPILAFIPWFNILRTHINTGTPWISYPQWFEWIRVFLVNILETIPVPFELVPTVLYGTTLFMLLAVTALKCFRQRNFLNSMGIENPYKLFVITLCLVVPAAIEGYITPQADRYMVPFAPFEWFLFNTCAVVWWRYLILLYQKHHPNTDGHLVMWGKSMALVGALFVLIYFNWLNIATLSKLPLSAARPLSKDVIAGKFKDTAFIFVPDMTICAVAYYLDQDKLAPTRPDHLEALHGCIRWSDTTPYIPAQYEELFKNPCLLQETEARISNLSLTKYPKLALVRESYLPATKKMPCLQMADALRLWLDKTYQFKGNVEYMGLMEAYSVSLFDRKLPESK